MTTGGWISMIVSVSFVTGLLAWCLYKVMSTPAESIEHMHGELDIQVKDKVED